MNYRKGDIPMVSGEKLCKNKSKLSTTKKKKCEKNGNIVWKKSKL